MERLTKTISCQDEARLYDISNELFGLNISRADKTRMILEKLAEYEDLEEQGRLIKLPCKAGDTVYVNGVLGCGEAEEYRVIRVDYHSTLGTGKTSFILKLCFAQILIVQ